MQSESQLIALYSSFSRFYNNGGGNRPNNNNNSNFSTRNNRTFNFSNIQEPQALDALWALTLALNMTVGDPRLSTPLENFTYTDNSTSLIYDNLLKLKFMGITASTSALTDFTILGLLTVLSALSSKISSDSIVYCVEFVGFCWI